MMDLATVVLSTDLPQSIYKECPNYAYSTQVCFFYYDSPVESIPDTTGKWSDAETLNRPLNY